jgi:hypothetical protein
MKQKSTNLNNSEGHIKTQLYTEEDNDANLKNKTTLQIKLTRTSLRSEFKMF